MPKVLEILHKFEHSGLYSTLARSATTPREVLQALIDADSPYSWVIQDIAINPHAPLDILEQLANHEHWTVRRALVLNPAIPLSLLAVMVEDLDPDISSLALEKFNERSEQNPEVSMEES
jgi:hypothetical protein